VDPAWAFVYEEAMEEAKPLVQKLSKMKVALPEVGYEIMDGKGRIIADTELAWPEMKVAVVWNKEEQKAKGWQFFEIAEEESLIEALKEKNL
jgi:DEAD/DEAH box helicase domain-containing protein